VLQSLRDLALSQQAHVVAEGVETRQQLQVIRELDIGAGQGYLLGRPDASVEATFVDLGKLGSERPFQEAAVPQLPLAAGQVAPLDSHDARDGHDGASGVPGIRSIVLPRPRLGTRFEVETGSA